MYLDYEWMAKVTFEQIRKAVPGQPQRNTITLAGIPMFLAEEEGNVAFLLFPDLKYTDAPLPVGGIIERPYEGLIQKVKEAAWCRIEGELCLRHGVPTVVTAGWAFFDKEGTLL
jgi:hypothetical protein